MRKRQKKLMEVSRADLRQAVEGLHNCRATFRQTVHVKEEFQGQTAWEGVVHVFDIDGHPDANTCYAWSAPVEGSDRRKVYAVLAILPVTSPEEAVRAAVIKDFRG